MKITNLKGFIGAISILMILQSCKKSNEQPAAQTYTSTKGTTLTLQKADWYTKRNNNGGVVYLKLIGYSNAEKITVRTIGDGLITDYPLDLDANKYFNQDVAISFTESGVQSGKFSESTKLTAYRGTDTLTVTLNSGASVY